MLNSLKTLSNYIRDKHDVVYKISLAILSVAIIVWVFPQEGKFKYEFQQGKPWLHEDLIAPFDFAINKTDGEISFEQKEIIQNSKPYFVFDDNVPANVKTKFFSLIEKEFPSGSANAARYKGFANEFLDKIYTTGLIDKADEKGRKTEHKIIYVVRNKVAEEIDIDKLLTISDAFNELNKELSGHNDLNKALVLKWFEECIRYNVLFDPATTSKLQREQLENISLSKEMRQKGQRIISRGDLVDEEKFRILQSLRSDYLTQVGDKDNFFYVLGGQAILVGMCVLVLVVFLISFRYDIFLDNRKFLFLLMILVLFSLMAGISIHFKSVIIYALPFCIMPVLVRAFFDTRVALFTHLVSILIVGLIAPNPYEFVFIQLMGGIFAIFSIINLRNRSQLFTTVAVILLAYLLSYYGISVIQEGTISGINWSNLLWFTISSVMVLFAYPLIFIFEKVFGFVSDISLLELSDINSPLMRELALKAPGTFQHSLQVANLAEEAVYHIGGSALLVRTGALYHDIGKMEMPLYFIENQQTGINPHDELSFEDSAAIIIGHVSKGIELAKEYNIPDPIIDFIRTHHGCNKAEYFYREFLRNFPDEVVDEKLFQYPGPIPFSKETAVLMMADSVEAASRSLKRYDEESLNNLVERVINHLVERNQFVNADITFKDISSIKKIFKKRLMNVYHLRIEYPS
jgi:cyclic-di-AMP phosphodiesterase PgpH